MHASCNAKLITRASPLAAPGIIGAALLGDALPSRAFSGGVTLGDISILRFLAALEIIEHDLWEQYNELCGIQGH
jgi:hypothetical protein